MKKTITYGTFDLFHQGHYNLLKRAKDLGDYLIVGVTTDFYDKSRGKLNVHESLMQRIENVRRSGLADEIIIEEYEGQKVEDIQKYGVDIFAIGSDWKGKFDYLKEFCDVVYLDRTKGISSTQIRQEKNKILKIGIIGAGRIAKRFVKESKYVSGIEVEGVLTNNLVSCKNFAENMELNFFTTSFAEFIQKIDAVYIASPHKTHYDYIKKSLEYGKHVLCEKPLVLCKKELENIYKIAKDKKLVLMEAIKTAYCPGFEKLLSIAKSGIIGEIKDVEAGFTKLYDNTNLREFDIEQAGGSVTELASYPLFAIVKLLGKPEKVDFISQIDSIRKIDLYTKILMYYPKNIVAVGKVGLGVKTEGDLVISGTKGYVYVPAPWWKTEYFELRFEDSNKNKKYFYQFQEDGLRYEIADFLNMVNNGILENYKLKNEESKIINSIICDFLSQRENLSK